MLVKHTGDGVEPELMAALFEPFQQGRQITRRTLAALRSGGSSIVSEKKLSERITAE